MVSMLDVCTEWQKELLEFIATWKERKDRNGDELEAALIYLFFSNGCLFDPPDFPCFVKLTREQLAELEKRLEYFLPRAEKIGYEHHVKEALKLVKAELSSLNTRYERWKISLQSYFRFFWVSYFVFVGSWLFVSWKTALYLAFFSPLILMFLNELLKIFREKINASKKCKLAYMLRRINYHEIKILKEWSASYLHQRKILKRHLSSEPTIIDPEAMSDAYEKWGI